MSSNPFRDATPPGDQVTPHRREFAWRFGMVELMGLSFSIAFLFGMFALATSDERIDERDRRSVVVMVTAIAILGTYLSSRLASRLRIRSNWKRFALQQLCTLLLVPPLFCLAIVTFPLLYALIPSRWSKPDDNP